MDWIEGAGSQYYDIYIAFKCDYNYMFYKFYVDENVQFAFYNRYFVIVSTFVFYSKYIYFVLRFSIQSI